jgi:signal transduction histidine kinase
MSKNMTSTTQHPSFIQSIWLWLVRPSPTLTDEEAKRKSPLLAAMLVLSLVIGAVLITILLAIAPEQINTSDTRAIILGLVLLPFWWGINRTGRIQTAANLYVLTLYFVFALPVYGIGSSASSLAFVALSFLLGAIFFSTVPFLMFTGLGTVLVAVLIGIYQADPTSQVSVNPVTYLAILFFLVMMALLTNTFVLYLRRTEAFRRQQLETANEQLRASEASLEQRVKERTHALDIALKQAEEANIVKSQFLASTSHELRTPLNAIINFGEFLQQGMLGEINDDQAEASEHIISSGRHLLALINDVLDISKIEAGALQLYVEDNVNLNNELTDLLKTATTLLKNSPVKAVLDVPEPLPLVRGDRIRIRQIMLNLISNACKFTEQGTVTVRAIRQDSEVVVSVTDTGPGIQAADFDKIFETFRQTEVGIRKGKGTGLGLPIARRLAEAHGGLLTVESIIGQGAAFTVRLPIKSDNLIPSNVES